MAGLPEKSGVPIGWRREHRHAGVSGGSDGEAFRLVGPGRQDVPGRAREPAPDVGEDGRDGRAEARPRRGGVAAGDDAEDEGKLHAGS